MSSKNPCSAFSPDAGNERVVKNSGSRRLLLTAALALGVFAGQLAARPASAACATVDANTFAAPKMPTDITNVLQLEASLVGHFALQTDNTLRAWNSAGPLAGLEGMKGVRAIATTSYHGLVLKTDGSVQAFGVDSSYGETVVPTFAKAVVQIAAGDQMSYALLSDGTITAWGGSNAVANFGVMSMVGNAANMKSITARGFLAGGVTTTGTVASFINPSLLSGYKPPVGLSGVVKLAATTGAFLALKDTGTVVGWPTTGPAGTVPAGLSGVVDIVTDDNAACAIKIDGKVTCWGSGSWAGLQSATDVSKVALSYDALYTSCPGCGSTPSAGCCADDTLSQCVNGSVVQTTCAAGTCGYDGTAGIACATAGAEAPGVARKGCNASGHACIPDCTGKDCGSDGCGGSCGTCPAGITCNASNQCPVAALPTSCQDVAVDGASLLAKPWIGGSNAQIVEHRTTATFAIARRSDGTLSAAGNVPAGLISDMKLGNLTGIKAIAAAAKHVLIIDGSGFVHAYGDASVQSALNVPGSLAAPSGIYPSYAVAAGDTASYALGVDGTVHSWGNGGVEDTITYSNNQANYKSIVAAGALAMGIKTDNSIHVFSANYGTLAPPADLTNVKSIATDGEHLYALTTKGTVVGWGSSAGTYGSPVSWTGIASLSSGTDGLVGIDLNGQAKFYALTNASKAGTLLTGAKGISNLSYSDGYFVVTSCPSACGSVGAAGCCDGNQYLGCDASGNPTGQTCAQACGWSGTSYGCVANANVYAPNDMPATMCMYQCTPACNGKQCGDDGCLGSCGTCGANETCDASGKCQCTPNCNGKTCGDDGCGGTCGTCAANHPCDVGTGVCSPTCVGDCTGKKCGDDGCGGTCGCGGACCDNSACQPDGTCKSVCTPNCTGKTCGDDGCGGSCGTCSGAYGTCGPLGTCVCTPNCTGKCGGSDGCGGTCFATCPSGQACNTGTSQTGYTCGCAKQCNGKNCGDDGCGGVCGYCNSPETCQADGTCKYTCTPNCTGKACGDDGCGGSCGTCGSGLTCDNYKTYQCLNVCQPNCAGKTCGDDGCSGWCGLCPGGTSCDATSQCKCTPQCNGKTCGPDGCGGTCGTCGSGSTCGTNGNCAKICVPNCAGKNCGSDGCGGTCGKCAGATQFCHAASGTCRDGQCPNIPIQGCCDGETAYYCGTNGVNVTKNCTAQGQYCGWEPSAANMTISATSYMCLATPLASDPAGKAPRVCPGKPACVPNCSGKGCGSDGCGGSCGTCTGDKQCEFGSGKCVASPCGDVPTVGCCKDGTAVACDPVTKKPTFTKCASATSSTPQQCVWNTNAFQCTASSLVSQSPNTYATPTQYLSTCPASVCVPQCSGKTCGPDGCGGTCGSCGAGSTCNATGTCKANVCVPTCNQKKNVSGQVLSACGYSDGCGGSCGCAPTEVCDSATKACMPNLDCAAVQVYKYGCCDASGGVMKAKVCGAGKVQIATCANGCGWGDDGWGGNAYQCNPAGVTLPPSDPTGKWKRVCPGTTCTPQCAGKTCGDDGCGGQCGTCGAGQCGANGQCISPCDDGYAFGGCCDGDVLKVCKKTSSSDTSTSSKATSICAPGTCGWNATTGSYGCGTSGGSDPTGAKAKTCACVPNCAGKTCGADGCGGQCGTCNAGQKCVSVNPTQSNSYATNQCCAPSCSGKTCGSDGCGGTCGSCPNGQGCDVNGACVSAPPPPSCANTPWQGSCSGEVLQFCSAGQLVKQDCSNGPHCGWNASLGAYSCGTNGQADPAGQYPKASAGTPATCVPNCAGKQCGDDGCGGTCGQCLYQGAVCQNAKCAILNPKTNTYTTNPGHGVCAQGSDYKLNLSTGQCLPTNWGECALGSQHPGKNYCGEKNVNWECQCDAACVDRGDCCADALMACASIASVSGTITCGDGKCQADLGENCSTCAKDCPDPTNGQTCTPPSVNTPPWQAPFFDILGLIGTVAQQSVVASTVLDSVLPTDAPYPRAGLVAYVPRDGTVVGGPLVKAIAGSVKDGGVISTTPGAQGMAIRIGNGTTPTWGTERILLERPLPAKASALNKSLGGLTLSMWVRVPTTAPAVVNPIAMFSRMDTAANVGSQPLCRASRPGDTTLEISCPNANPSAKPAITSVYAYYGTVGAGTGVGAVSCTALSDSKTKGDCTDASIQNLAETACLGKANCTVAAPAAPACATASGEKPVLFVRAACGYASTTDWPSPSLVVEAPASNGSSTGLLRFGTDNATALHSKDSVNDGIWRQVAITFLPYDTNGAGRTTLYVDGVEQESTTAIRFAPFAELVLGAARLSSMPATAPNLAGSWLAGVVDVDEVFLFDRALSAGSIIGLAKKRINGVLAQWPVTDVQKVLATSAGLEGAQASAVPVQSAVLNDMGSYTASATGKPLQTTWSALSVQSGKYAPKLLNADIASVADFTLAGWVRSSQWANGGSILRLLEGSTEQVSINVQEDCGAGARGITAKVLGGKASAIHPSLGCAHLLKSGEWHFVTAVRKAGLLYTYLDGAIISAGSSASSSPLFAGDAATARTLEVPAGVDIGWATLIDHALDGQSVASLNSPGPATWLDGLLYWDGATARLRDFANFHNNLATGSQMPAVYAQDGSSVAQVYTQGAANTPGTISLQDGGTGTNALIIPMQGRLGRFSMLKPVRPFTWVGNVRGKANQPLFTYGFAVKPQSGIPYGWVPKIHATWTYVESPLQTTCAVGVTAERDDGTRAQWATSIAFKGPPSPSGFDVAIAFDGKDAQIAISSAGTNFVGKSAWVNGDQGVQTVEVTENPPALTNQGALMNVKLPDGPYLKLYADSSYPNTGASTFNSVRVYPRALIELELNQVTNHGYDALKCADRNRETLPQVSSGALPSCGACFKGMYEPTGQPGGTCIAQLGWGKACTGQFECASGLCLAGKCTSPAVTDECKSECHKIGRGCEKVPVASNLSYTQCTSACLPFYSKSDPDPNGMTTCEWEPTTEAGGVCTADDQCMAGGCSQVVDAVYNMTVDRNPECKADGTCPGWFNTSDSNKPFKCAEKYGMTPQATPPAVCMWYPQGSSTIQAVGRCDGGTAQACTAAHMQAELINTTSTNGTARYKCDKCSAETWKDAKGKSQPLWVKRWRLISPEVCQTMHANLVRAFLMHEPLPGMLYVKPTAAQLGRFVLGKPANSTLDPVEFAKLITIGVGPELINYMLDKDRAAYWDALYPNLTLADCAKDPSDPKPSPFTDPNVNYQICAANQFPDGTACPPKDSNGKPYTDAQGNAIDPDEFCQSGFCARDTGVCEEGYGRYENADNADRNDDKQPEDPSQDAIAFVQSNVGAKEFKKIKDPTLAKKDPQRRNFSQSMKVSNTLKIFGTSNTLMGADQTLGGDQDAPKSASLSQSVIVFGVTIPGGGDPPSKCDGAKWENGKFKQKAPDAKCAMGLTVNWSALPKLKFCGPVPGKCASAGKPGAVCRSKLIIGPFGVPITIEAAVQLTACVEVGAGVDPKTFEGGLLVTPNVGIGVSVKGGVGFKQKVGGIEVKLFGGVKAAITIVKLSFPIKFMMGNKLIEKTLQGNNLNNMHQLGLSTSISAEMNVLKLLMSFFFEAGTAVGLFDAKLEWEQKIFEFGGFTFGFKLANGDPVVKKIDFEDRSSFQ